MRLKGREHDYWMGTETGMLGGYAVQGQVTAGDGSDKQGKIGAGYNNLRRKKKKQQCKVGREEEGPSSNRPELAVFFLALRDTLIESPIFLAAMSLAQCNKVQHAATHMLDTKEGRAGWKGKELVRWGGSVRRAIMTGITFVAALVLPCMSRCVYVCVCMCE